MIKKSLLFFGFSAALLVSACDNNNSVFNPDYKLEGKTPVINEIVPANRYLAGVNSIVIKGENFSTNIEDILIDFDGSPGVILEASETELTVRPGFKTGANLPVKIGVKGAEFFSDKFPYTLDPVETNHPGFTENYRPLSVVAIDEDESVYGFFNIQGSVDFRKITKDGVISVYSENTRFTTYSGAKFGPDGGLYIVTPATPRAAIFRMPPGGNPPATNDEVWAAPPQGDGAKFADLTFDANNYIWVVGNNTNIYRYNFADKSMKRFPFEGNLRTSFVHNNELYVAGTDTSGITQKVWKFPIDGSNNLGAEVEVLNFSANNTGTIRSINFDSDSNMYLGVVDSDYGIYKFKDNTLTPLYPYVLGGESYYNLLWDESGNMIGAKQSADNGTLLFTKIDMLGKTRATVHGF